MLNFKFNGLHKFPIDFLGCKQLHIGFDEVILLVVHTSMITNSLIFFWANSLRIMIIANLITEMLYAVLSFNNEAEQKNNKISTFAGETTELSTKLV